MAERRLRNRRASAVARPQMPLSTAPPPPVIRPSAVTTLAQMGVRSSIVLLPRTRSRPVSFEIFARPHSAPQRWYMVRLRFVARTHRHALTGAFGFVTASIDGQTCASVKFAVGGRGGRTRIDWNTEDVFGGQTHRTRRNDIPVSFQNYAVTASVAPGVHRLRIGVEEYRGRLFDQVSVAPTSGVIETPDPPDPVRLSVRDASLSAGHSRARIVLEIANRSSVPARHVTVSAGSADSLSASSLQRLRDLGPHAMTVTTLDVGQIDARYLAAQVVVVTDHGRDQAVVRLARIAPIRPSRFKSVWAAIVFVCACFVVAASRALLRARRHATG